MPRDAIVRRSPRVLLIQRIVPAYRHGFLRALAQQVDLLVVHSAERPGSTVADTEPEGVRCIRVPRLYLGAARKSKRAGWSEPTWVLQAVLGPILAFRPDVVIVEGSVGIVANWPVLWLRWVLGYRVLAWTFGYHPNRGLVDPLPLRDKVRVALYRAADGVVVYWRAGADAVARYVDPLRVFVAPNVVDTSACRAVLGSLEQEGRSEVRRRLDVRSRFVLLFLGRLISVKQTDAFVRLVAALRARGVDVEGVVVGDGPERESLEALAAEVAPDAVRFTGELTEECDVGQWAFAADLTVIPGRLGLAVSHSLAYGTPVVSRTHPGHFHGEGVQYLVDGVSGAWCEPSDESLVGCVAALLADAVRLEALRESAHRYYRENMSMESMVDGFLAAIDAIRPASIAPSERAEERVGDGTDG